MEIWAGGKTQFQRHVKRNSLLEETTDNIEIAVA